MQKLACWVVAALVFASHPAFSQRPDRRLGPDALTDHAAARFLDQATWGPTPASIAEFQSMGISAWLNQQFSLNTSDLPDQPRLNAAGQNNTNLAPVQAAFFQNALTGQDQLRQRVAFALSEIWVVSADSAVNNAYAYPPYWRVFRDNAFGNYRDIINAVSLNPAMGTYLNMANNNKGNPAKNTAANENYARELMQLFTLGLAQLNPDGSPVVDASGNPVPTYSQADVTNVAKMLTGWTYPTAPGATAKSNNPYYYVGQMFPVDAEHDTTAKTIFAGISVPAGQTTAQDLNSLLDGLMQQTTMAPFVCQQLIQHLVTSNPSPAYIERISNVFLDNGSGVRGDMKAVIAAILTDPEARAGDNLKSAASPNFGHLREPVLFMANILRGLNATLGASSAIYNNANSQGQDLFYAPSVFSYFAPQNALPSGLLGPEFQIYTTQTAAQRADIVNSALYGTLDKSTKIDLTPFLQYGSDTGSLLDYISYVFLHHSMSAALQQQALAAANANSTALARVQAALYIVLTSGEYQIVQ
jgi:uncharacterized protein (DUF1800 family)